METYDELRELKVTTREAAGLLGLSRTTIYRKPTTPKPRVVTAPLNKLSDAERTKILEVLNSDEFVDLPSLQVYQKLLDEGTYMGSVSTINRVLEENQQVRERRALAKHLARQV